MDIDALLGARAKWHLVAKLVGGGAKVPGCSPGSTICLAFSTHPSPNMELTLHTPHTCLESPFWICLKLLLLQGWDVLGPPKSTSAPSITTPQRGPQCPRTGRPEPHPSRTLGCQHDHAPPQRPESRMDLSQGDLVMLLCLQFIRFSVSSINQGRTLFLHTREWGRHTGNRQKTHGG